MSENTSLRLPNSCSDNRKFKIENRKLVGITALVIAFAMCGTVAQAQEPAKVLRIGFLVASNSSANSDRIAAFQNGLRELGYMEGKNIIVEYRQAEGKLERLPKIAAELVGRHVDVIVTAGPADTRAAKNATTTIPVVMTFDNDPVGNGFVASLARPGGNITGLSTLAPELSGKQLELLKEIVPKLSRAAVFGNSRNPGNTVAIREIELAGETLRVKLQKLDVVDSKDVKAAFRTASKERDEAVLVLGSPLINAHRAQIAALATKNRLPAIYYTAEMVEAGGLMAYGVNRNDLARRAATYVDKILKGAKPADLPVEQPTKFELIINLKAAKQIGLTIPPAVLARADRVIR
jgi:putative ABC transport system substrate-binding protein